jgi:hypothetical protein
MKFTKPLLITKLKATGVHLSLSLAVFVYLVYQIYYHWFPQPYFSIDGGWQGIRIIAGVDLVLVPLITFLIFDLRKSRREIVSDLTIIVVIQLSALSYGVYLAYSQRPVAVVFIDEYMISTTMEQYGGKLESESQLRQYSDQKPPIIFSDLPTDMQSIQEMKRIKSEENVPEHAQMQRYRPKTELLKALKEKQALLFKRLDSFGYRDAYETWLKQSGKSDGDVLIARFPGRYGEIWLVLDQDGNYLSYFP